MHITQDEIMHDLVHFSRGLLALRMCIVNNCLLIPQQIYT